MLIEDVLVLLFFQLRHVEMHVGCHSLYLHLQSQVLLLLAMVSDQQIEEFLKDHLRLG